MYIWAETAKCDNPPANWELVVITFLVCFAAVILYLIYRLTDKERLKIMLDEENKIYKEEGLS